MVRRHDRFRTFGLDTVFRETCKGGQCIHSVAELEPPLQPHGEQLARHIARTPRPERARTAPSRPERARRSPNRSECRSSPTSPGRHTPPNTQERSELRLKCQFCLLDSEDIISTYFTF